jgi:ribosomal protein L24E
MSSNKKIVVNGKEEKPINKKKLPRDMDWQKIAKEKNDK